MIHYTGDVHQPLHSETLVNATYPKGDAGGNYEHVPSQSGVSNLHAIWDSVIYEYPGYPAMPLSDSDWEWYTQTAAEMALQFPVTGDINSMDVQAWAEQSYNLALQYSYPGFVTGQIPSAEYQATALPIVKQNMMLGAVRLANLIENIYGKYGLELFLN